MPDYRGWELANRKNMQISTEKRNATGERHPVNKRNAGMWQRDIIILIEPTITDVSVNAVNFRRKKTFSTA